MHNSLSDVQWDWIYIETQKYNVSAEDLYLMIWLRDEIIVKSVRNPFYSSISDWKHFEQYNVEVTIP